MKIQALYLLLCFFAFADSGIAQNEKADSLKAVIPSLQEDTTKVDALLDLSSNLFRTHPDTAIIYAEQAKDLAEKLDYHEGLGYALKNIGLVLLCQE